MNPTLAELDLLQEIKADLASTAESNTHQLTVIAQNTDVSVRWFVPLTLSWGLTILYLPTTKYANILNRALDLGDVAGNKLTIPVLLVRNLEEENQFNSKGLFWVMPKKKTSGVFTVPDSSPNTPMFVGWKQSWCTVWGTDPRFNWAKKKFMVGNLLAGESPLTGVLSNFHLMPGHHIGLFGRTGCGKSNLMMVFLESILNHNRLVSEQERWIVLFHPGHRSSWRIPDLACPAGVVMEPWHCQPIQPPTVPESGRTLLPHQQSVGSRRTANEFIMGRHHPRIWSVVEMTDQQLFCNLFSNPMPVDSPLDLRWVADLFDLSRDAAENDIRSLMCTLEP